MPSPYARNRRALKAEIVAQVGAGQSLRAMGAGPGMPCAHTVRKWALADPRFAAELAAARARQRDRRGRALDEAKAAASLARARSNAALGERGRARRLGFDPRLAERIIERLMTGARLEAVLRADPELPCRPTLRRWRREAPVFDAALKEVFTAVRRRRERTVPPALAAFVAEAIKDGETFAGLAREGLASRTTLRRWYRADAAFARAVDDACDEREETLDFELWVAAERVMPGPPKEMTRQIAPITRRIARLRHRPGAVHRPRGEAEALTPPLPSRPGRRGSIDWASTPRAEQRRAPRRTP